MAAASRLPGACAPLQLHASSSSPSNAASSNAWRCRRWSSSANMKVDFGSKRQVAAAAVSESSVLEERRKGEKEGVVDLALLEAVSVADGVGRILRPAGRRKAWRLRVEMLVESAVINCRFFALIALFGSLLASILCLIQPYGDSFLIGTVMLTFGVGVYGLFVSSKQVNEDNKKCLIPESSFFGVFPLKVVISTDSTFICIAKSKIGHSVLILLQTGLVEKLKNVPIVSGLDLACFAGAILFSSASIFLLSRLSIPPNARSSADKSRYMTALKIEIRFDFAKYLSPHKLMHGRETFSCQQLRRSETSSTHASHTILKTRSTNNNERK
ncbi:hypothetical protein ACLOJK_002940 [Asimina triloba]